MHFIFMSVSWHTSDNYIIYLLTHLFFSVFFPPVIIYVAAKRILQHQHMSLMKTLPGSHPSMQSLAHWIIKPKCFSLRCQMVHTFLSLCIGLCSLWSCFLNKTNVYLSCWMLCSDSSLFPLSEISTTWRVVIILA